MAERTFEAAVLDGLQLFDELTVRIDGTCMQPDISDRALVKLERRKLYLPGDIVAFRNGIGQLVCHRFLGYRPGRSGWRALTRADNAANPDACTRPDRLLGKVISSNHRPVSVTLKHRGAAILGFLGASFPAV